MWRSVLVQLRWFPVGILKVAIRGRNIRFKIFFSSYTSARSVSLSIRFDFSCSCLSVMNYCTLCGMDAVFPQTASDMCVVPSVWRPGARLVATMRTNATCTSSHSLVRKISTAVCCRLYRNMNKPKFTDSLWNHVCENNIWNCLFAVAARIIPKQVIY